MNWDEIKGKWKQFSGKAKQEWGKLTDDDMERIAGRRDKMIGIIQEKYGIAREEATKKVDKFAASCNC